MSKQNTSYKSAENAAKIREKIQAGYNALNKKDFLPLAKPYDWDALSDEKLNLAYKLAYHCCVNGPVGVGKKANFPGVERRIKIKEEFKCSNSQWKGFCYVFRDYVDADKSISRAVEKFGDFWPTDNEMNKSRSKEDAEDDEDDM